MELVKGFNIVKKAVYHYPEYKEKPEVIRYYKKLAKGYFVIKRTMDSMIIHFYALFKSPKNNAVKKPIHQEPNVSKLWKIKRFEAQSFITYGFHIIFLCKCD